MGGTCGREQRTTKYLKYGVVTSEEEEGDWRYCVEVGEEWRREGRGTDLVSSS